jgi:hypothetical protein
MQFCVYRVIEIEPGRFCIGEVWPNSHEFTWRVGFGEIPEQFHRLAKKGARTPYRTIAEFTNRRDAELVASALEILNVH